MRQDINPELTIQSNQIEGLRDRLTGLIVLDQFYTQAQVIIQKSNNAEALAFVYFDVENFKAFNSEYGHSDGNVFLKELASLIQRCFPASLVGRTSNDHFIVLTTQDGVLDRVDTVHTQIHQIHLGLNMNIRAGLYNYKTGTTMQQAHDRVKLACDVLKGNYSQYYHYYDDTLHQRIVWEKYVVDHIDSAIEQEQFVVYYQPIRRVMSGQVCGLESLVRWEDPEYGFLMPGKFIPILEKRQLIHKLDTYVLDRVCRDLTTAEKLGQALLPVSINLSQLDFRLMDVYKMVSSTVKRYGIPSRLIHVEITESALNEDSQTISTVMKQLRSDGFELWLDDFGSAYSTLNALHNFDFDLLKLDMAFFTHFDTNEKARTIVVSIVDMAKRLNMRVLAEGIETKEQYAFLKTIGCDKAQGFYICRPQPLDVLYGHPELAETIDGARYFTDLGAVNVLSSTPTADHRLYNAPPTAIVEYSHNQFTYLYANNSFMEVSDQLDIHTIENAQIIINDNATKLKLRLEGLMKKANASRGLEELDFILYGHHMHVRAKLLASRPGANAYFVNMVNLDDFSDRQRLNRLETSLSFLYSIYERVDIIDPALDRIENIYLSSQYYQSFFGEKTVKQALEHYAMIDIAPEDRQKFLQFYDMETLKQRIIAGGKDYIANTIRTNTLNDGVVLQLYMIIRVNDGQNTRYLSCVRDVDEIVITGLSSVAKIDNTEADRLYRLICDELNMVILEWDMYTQQVSISNQGYKYMFSHERLSDILNNRASLDIIHPEDISLVQQFFKETESGNSRAEAKLRLQMVDGSYQWSHLIGLFEYDQDGNRSHVIGMIQDIEQQQRNLEQATLFNQMPIALGIFEVTNGNVRQIFMNDRYYLLMNDSRRNRANHHTEFLHGIHPEDRHLVQAAMKIVIDGADECGGDCRVSQGNGEYKRIHFASAVALRRDDYILVYSTYSEIRVDYEQ